VNSCFSACVQTAEGISLIYAEIKHATYVTGMQKCELTSKFRHKSDMLGLCYNAGLSLVLWELL